MKTVLIPQTGLKIVNEDIHRQQDVLNDSAGSHGASSAPDSEIDFSLLEESLRMTPWERMLANDDALNFGESLRAAMERHHAKPQ
jgi:hypothetical protein